MASEVESLRSESFNKDISLMESDEGTQPYDFETEYSRLLKSIGGFGRFQVFIAGTILFGCNSTTFVYNCLGYLEL
jgi:hypothetical protein